MFLCIDAIISGSYQQNACFPVQSYESAFELLTQQVSSGSVLHSVLLVDGGDTLCLPIEAFDGNPIAVHIKAIEKQWQQLLKAQSSSARFFGFLKGYYLNQDAYYDRRLTLLGKTIFQLQSLQSDLESYPWEAPRFRLARRNQVLLENYRTLYQSIVEKRQSNLLRIHKLEKLQAPYCA